MPSCPRLRAGQGFRIQAPQHRRLAFPLNGFKLYRHDPRPLLECRDERYQVGPDHQDAAVRG